MLRQRIGHDLDQDTGAVALEADAAEIALDDRQQADRVQVVGVVGCPWGSDRGSGPASSLLLEFD
jgi:hypothetical protein